ncbi:MAG: hypothetical protein PHW52_02455, partial [Candidatus Pacebacteria bacterium]|nr:hypothetical protein [Candidatus Paceibacterota bacterium]
CGSSNGGTFTTIPTTGLCNSGTPSSVFGTGPWTWTCTGLNGGTTSSCSASKTPDPINGQCGSSNGGTFTTIPTTGLCNSGTPSSVFGTGPWTWTCTGLNGGGTSNCFASKTPDPVNGQCGTSDGGTFGTIPTTNLCTTGTATTVSGAGPWYWTCQGANGGTAASCSASKTPDPVNGQCGTSDGGTFATIPTTNLCTTGTASSVSGLGLWTWTCAGLNGGTTSSCSASKTPDPVNGQCGTSDGGTFTTIPATNLCATGTATTVSGAGPWYWTCQGANGGTAASCSASKTPDPVNGQCGASNGSALTGIPTQSLCALGTPSVVSGTGPWTWTCTGLNGGTTASCSATKVTNGQCGTSNGGTFTIAPVAGLCASGTPTSAAWNGYNWAWACQSCDGGATDFCYAYRPASEVCGASNGGTFDTAPITNLCSVGIASAVSGTGPWYWTCNNSQGLAVGSCSANKSLQALSMKLFSSNTCECEKNQSVLKSSAMDYFSTIAKNNSITSNPIVRIVGAREVNPGQSITLRSVVTDYTNTKLTYYWSCTGGTISNVNELSPKYTAHTGPNILKNNVCTLMVRNGKGGITTKSVNITIR